MVRIFREYWEAADVKHILASSYHPQTNSESERYYCSVKEHALLLVYLYPWELKKQLLAFVNYYNSVRYYKSLGNVIIDDVYFGKKEWILAKRLFIEQQNLTWQRVVKLKIEADSLS